ncbi:hypothetical protein LJC68_06815 [Bacteroidales bacterium OttesenSCG-928-B11]|nr:hypothetical protein [Bacteroidales bacterium OttesenSCG-928-E04]MDL2312572.1 hypothetical protein [Bacteroidales bacterium OttesenSCG-928-B11]MDL2325835.1 hypothetical protein [Bacteroidales bacterium OttesenSCG-928-A14]
MKKKIPKIIHQIWSGIEDPIPETFIRFGESWKRDYPDWEYVLWDHAKMENFVEQHYPEYSDIYHRFPYNIQRWDAIRYLILYKLGGMYVDFDYESLKSLQPVLEGRDCCFPSEQEADPDNGKKLVFNNALMACVPAHPFMRAIIEKVFTEESLNPGDIKREDCVMKTTGPWMLMELYESISPEMREKVYLIPSRYVTPLNPYITNLLKTKLTYHSVAHCLEEAYAIHHFYNTWIGRRT